MKLTIDEDSFKKVGISIPEALMILLIKTGVTISDLIKEMKEKQIIVEENSLMGKSLLVTQRWNDLCDSALLNAEDNIPKGEKLSTLARALMDCFPEGRKEGTSQYWRGNIRDITLKLQKFFKLYGNKYTDEQLINATKRYVTSFNGRYQFMRVLKYFICKNEKKVDSEGINYIEEVSDLAAYIENEGHEKSLKDDWMSTMV
jgi:hypothetical protein